jgi:hypothetical protein
MKLDGWKAIGAFISEIWGRPVAARTAMRYEQAADPLPITRAFRRVVGDVKKLRRWARRNVATRGNS